MSDVHHKQISIFVKKGKDRTTAYTSPTHFKVKYSERAATRAYAWCPLMTAWSSADQPLLSFSEISASCSRSSRTMLIWPFPAAIINGDLQGTQPGGD